MLAEIGLILLAVVVVAAVVVFLLWGRRERPLPSGPRTVAELVQLKAAEQAAAAGAADQPADDEPAEAAPADAPAVPAPRTADVDVPEPAAAPAAATTAVAAGRSAASAVAPPSPGPTAAAAGPAAPPAGRTGAPSAGADDAPSPAGRAQPRVPAAAVPPVEPERGDVSPPWERVPDGSLVLPATSEPEDAAGAPSWTWRARGTGSAAAGGQEPSARSAGARPQPAGRSTPAEADRPSGGSGAARAMGIAGLAAAVGAGAALGRHHAAASGSDKAAAAAPPADADADEGAGSGTDTAARTGAGRAADAGAAEADGTEAEGGVGVRTAPDQRQVWTLPPTDETPEPPTTRSAGAGTAAAAAQPADAPATDSLDGWADWADVDDSESDRSARHVRAPEPTPAFGLPAVSTAAPSAARARPTTAPSAAPAPPTDAPSPGPSTAPAPSGPAPGGPVPSSVRGTDEQRAVDVALLRTLGFADPNPRPGAAPVVELAAVAPAESDVVQPDGEADAPAPRPVEFRVVTRDGSALPGATVTLLDGHGTEIGVATADDQGRGRLTAPRADSYVLVGTARQHQPGVAALVVGGDTGDDGEPQRVELVLRGSASVSGTVRAGQDRPVGAATVVLLQDGEVVDTAPTSPSGEYRLADLAAGAYTVTVSAAGHDPSAALLELAEGAATTHDVTLAPAALERRPVEGAAR